MKILAQEEISGLLPSPKRRNVLLAAFINYGLAVTTRVIALCHAARMRRRSVRPLCDSVRSSSLTSPRREL
jgi:hypothetical protein